MEPFAHLASALNHATCAKPLCRTLGITHSVHDVAVAEIGLNRARVDAVIGKVESGCAPQHVRVDGQSDTCVLA